MNRRTLIKWTGLTGLTAVGGGGALAAKNNGRNPYYSGAASDHFDGRIFFNPEGMPPAAFADLV